MSTVADGSNIVMQEGKSANSFEDTKFDKLAPSRYIVRCLLGAHGLFLCLCLLGAAAAQPSSASQNAVSGEVESLLRDLSAGGATGATAFKLFVQRAQLIVAGVIHISILLLPRSPTSNTGSATTTNNNTANNTGSSSSSVSPHAATPSGSSAGRNKRQGGPKTSANGAKAAASSSSSSIPAAPSREPAPGFPADGSDLEVWQRVTSAMEKESACGLDWSTCCRYELTQERGASVLPEPHYPLTATAAFYVARSQNEALVSNDYETQGGPHYADWTQLHAAGARSIAAAPIATSDATSDDIVIGVLTLASSEPQAFPSNRIVWLLSMALAPFVSTLRYASHSRHVEAFIARLLPPLLEENYRLTTAARSKSGSKSSNRCPSSGSTLSSTKPSRQQVRSQSAGTAAIKATFPGDKSSSSSGGGGGGVTQERFEASSQFAEHAEVLISAAPSHHQHPHHRQNGAVNGTSLNAPGVWSQAKSSSASTNGTGHGNHPGSIAPETVQKQQHRDNKRGSVAGTTGKASVNGFDAATSTPTMNTNGHMEATTTYPKEEEEGQEHALSSGDDARVVVKSSLLSARQSAPLDRATSTKPSKPSKPTSSSSYSATTPPSLKRVHSASQQGGEEGKSRSAFGDKISLMNATSANTVSTDPDLDWGDFFFNLVSMCIVYAYFSEAAVGGESKTAVSVSMGIAAADIGLLALRWLYAEHRISYSGALLHAFHLYRLVVLPAANTWMSWSLLDKLGVRPGGGAVALMGGAFLSLLVAGLRHRALLHTPLQLTSVLFTAASTTHVCTSAFGAPTGVKCMAAISVLQLTLGVAVPSLLVQFWDWKTGASRNGKNGGKSAGDKGGGGAGYHPGSNKQYLPHVQAKRSLFQS